MQTVDAAEFKEHCLALLDRLDADGLVAAKHGRAVARVIPYAFRDADLIGGLRHEIEVKGDIFSTKLVWQAAV